MQELQVMMLGASGVGKTSLLAAIYAQFESTIGVTNLQLIPVGNNVPMLQDRLVELKTLSNDIKARYGVKGSSDVRKFDFHLGARGKQPSQKISFIDYPGGYIGSSASEEDRKVVQDYASNSIAILLTIDAAALMEESGRWHEQVNRPQQMTDLFKYIFNELKSPKLVILSLVKCESYLQKDKSAELLQKIRVEYSNLLNLFSSGDLLNNVTVVIAPVQTVGNIVYSRVEEEISSENKIQPTFHYRKRTYSSSYEPKDCEQPLLYLLCFLLKMDIERNRFPGTNFFRKWLGMDKVLRDAIQVLNKGCKVTGGFVIVQGSKWLQID
jgi:GTPase SAR1 family protein